MSDLPTARFEADSRDELETLVKRFREVFRSADSYNQYAFLESCDELYCMILQNMEESWNEITKLSQKLRP